VKPIYQYDRFRTGLVGFGVLAFVVALVIGASRLNLGARSYSAKLEHSAGLRVGEPVQVAGVDVGKVTGIELDGNEVGIDFTVDDDITLGEETFVEVKISTLLGTHYLSVEPRGSGDVADGTIPVAQTRVPFNLQDVIEEGTPEVNEYDVVLIEKSLGEIAKVLDRSGDDVKPALVQVGELSGLVAARSDDIGRLLSAASGVTKQLTASSGDVLTLMKTSTLILDTLRTRRETIHALLADLTNLGVQLNGVVTDIKGDVGPTLRDLNVAIELLKAHEKSLGQGIDNLQVAGRYVANATGAGSFADLYAQKGLYPDNMACGWGILC
jgi:phospholipid/cholesterol/gamma-HCH transport system substrate-binding protein